MSSQPVKLASVGMGGYAGAMIDQFLRAAAEPNPPITFEAVCDPDQVTHAVKIAKLRAAGVKVFDNLDQLLAEPVEAVWLPVPIDLHRPFTEKAAAAGKVVICEKPAAGCVDDLDAMIAARDKHGVKAAIAFQDMYDDANFAVKRELVAGTIGKIKRIQLHACWMRGEKYYGRSTWAGKNKRNGAWVMDGPASNALAHFVNLALFFLGKTEREMADLSSVAAELYRVNPIETYDTCSMRVTTTDNVPLLIQFTHACKVQTPPVMEIEGELGRAKFTAQHDAVFEVGGQTKKISLRTDLRSQMIHKLAKWIRGDDSQFVMSFEMARKHLEVVNGASEAVAVKVVEGPDVEIITTPAGEKFRTLRGIESGIDQCAVSGKMFHESGLFPWTNAPGMVSLKSYSTFKGPKN